MKINKMKWIKQGIILMMISSMLITGCSSADGNEKNKGTDGEALETFDLVLDWYPNAVHSFIYVAMEKGYYEEEGLEVNIQFPANTNDAISLTAAGKADAGIYYMHDVVETNVEQDVPIRSIATIIQSPLTVFVSLKESNITSTQDMVGKTVGASSSQLTENIIGYMMEQQGHSVEDVVIQDVGFDLMSALTTGNVDLTYGGMLNHEVPQLEKEGFEVDYFFPTEYGMPNYYEMILITGEEQISEEEEKFAKFIRASKRGFEDVKADPEAALEIMLENQNAENFPLDEEVETKSLEMLLPLMELEEGTFMEQDVEIWQDNIDWLVENEMISKSIDAKEIVVDIE